MRVCLFFVASLQRPKPAGSIHVDPEIPHRVLSRTIAEQGVHYPYLLKTHREKSDAQQQTRGEGSALGRLAQLSSLTLPTAVSRLFSGVMHSRRRTASLPLAHSLLHWAATDPRRSHSSCSKRALTLRCNRCRLTRSRNMHHRKNNNASNFRPLIQSTKDSWLNSSNSSSRSLDPHPPPPALPALRTRPCLLCLSPPPRPPPCPLPPRHLA